jgi:hypothetical protein
MIKNILQIAALMFTLFILTIISVTLHKLFGEEGLAVRINDKVYSITIGRHAGGPRFVFENNIMYDFEWCKDSTPQNCDKTINKNVMSNSDGDIWVDIFGCAHVFKQGVWVRDGPCTGAGSLPMQVEEPTRIVPKGGK